MLNILQTESIPAESSIEIFGVGVSGKRSKIRKRRVSVRTKAKTKLTAATGKRQNPLNPSLLLVKVVRPERVELPTFWFVARRSIQLSYGRILVSSRIIIPLGRIFVKRKNSRFRRLGTKCGQIEAETGFFGPVFASLNSL